MDRLPDRDHLEQLLRPVVECRGMDLEEVYLAPVGRRVLVRVVVDRDGGVSLDERAGLNSPISAVLDDDEAMADRSYTLEVTSPGVDRPLTASRHWRRNVGRLVDVIRPDGTTLTGRIVDAGEGDAVLDVDGERKQVPYSAVRRAKVRVELTKPGRGTGAEGG